VLPVRADLAELLRNAKGDTSDADSVVKMLPRIPTHQKYLEAAGIAWTDDAGRRADLHALRHSHGTLLSKGGVTPREAMSLMRHTDLRLTMLTYTDPRIFDLAGAVEKLPINLTTPTNTQAAQATGTDDKRQKLMQLHLTW
jgi:integrase